MNLTRPYTLFRRRPRPCHLFTEHLLCTDIFVPECLRFFRRTGLRRCFSSWLDGWLHKQLHEGFFFACLFESDVLPLQLLQRSSRSDLSRWGASRAGSFVASCVLVRVVFPS